jgi:competence protein ComEC
VLLAYLAFCWLLGIVAADFAEDDPLVIALAAWLAAAIWLAIHLPRPVMLLAALGALVVVGGAWHYESSQPPDAPEGLAVYNDGQAVAFQAVVSDEPDERASSTRLRLSIREVLTEDGWQRAEGGVLVFLPTFVDYEYGDRLQVVGQLETPPQLEDFDYHEYLARQGINSVAYYPRVKRIASDEGSVFKEAIINVRQRLADSLHASLPEPQASLAEAFLIGRSASLSQGFTEDLRTTGTSHIVAISGYNVSVVAGLVLGSLAWLTGRRRAAVLALLAVAVYALLAGLDPPVLRAAIMGSLYVIATMLGRPSTAIVALLVAAAGMTAADPLLVHDVSFQLSFAATLGLMLFAPRLKEWLRSACERAGFAYEGPVVALVDVVAVTLAAIAFTLPITAINFGSISTIAPLANILIVPAFPFILVTSALVAIVGAIVPILGDALVWLVWPPLAYMAYAVRLLADIPGASVSISGFSLPHTIAYYAVLLTFVWAATNQRIAANVASLFGPLAGKSPEAKSWRLFPASGLSILLVLASVFVWLLVLNAPASRFSVTFLDVGQGDAILIRTPEGHKILVDGGPSDETVVEALGRYLPFWDRHLHLVVLSHPQADHLTGLLEVLEQYEVDQVLASPAAADTAVFRRWQEELGQTDDVYFEAESGQWVDLGDGAWLSVVYPPGGEALGSDPNEASVVLKLGWGDVSFLLTGDVEASAESLLAEEYAVQSTVLKVAHHGSRTSTTSEFLDAVDPLLAVVSVGADNRFGHPAPEILQRLEDTLLFRTDVNGDIRVSTDGKRLWVETQRR